MPGYILKRLFRAFITIWLVATFTFIASRATGDPLLLLHPDGFTAETEADLREYYGLDGGIIQQYGNYLQGFLTGDLGTSYQQRRSVTTMVAERLPITLQLALPSLVIAILLGVPAGVIAAVNRGKPIDSLILAVSFANYEPFDPELARERLEQSGYNGETIVLRAANNYYTNELLAVQVLKEMWEAIGITVELAIDAVLDEREFMVRTWSNPMYFPDPVGTWGAMWNPGGYRVPSDWDPEAEDYLATWETLRYSEDLDERREAYRRLQEISRDEVPYSILYQPIEYYGVSSSVNWQPLPGHQAYALDFNAYNLSFD